MVVWCLAGCALFVESYSICFGWGVCFVYGVFWAWFVAGLLVLVIWLRIVLRDCRYDVFGQCSAFFVFLFGFYVSFWGSYYVDFWVWFMLD